MPPLFTLIGPIPFLTYMTRDGQFTAAANGLIANVPAGFALTDLVAQGCAPATLAALSALPTTEPDTPGVPWLNGGIVQVS